MIAQCPGNCRVAHDYQDQRYGKGNRLMNEVRVKGELVGARCTVCAAPKEKGKKRPYFSLDQLRIIAK